MSGAATFSGTNYQSGVIALVYVHILKQTPLNWFEYFIDTPVGVSGETDGPGDDARIEFGDRHPPAELQAKHGLTAGAKLSEFVGQVRARSETDSQTKVVLVVDRTSSRPVHKDFALDLDRYRSGRGDRLRGELTRIIVELGEGAELLRRLYVATADVDRAADAERRFATHLLEDALTDPSQASAAWDVLERDAARICAERLRRTRQDIIDLLASKGIAVRPPEKDEAIMRQLDASRRLLMADKGSLAFSLLGMIEADAAGKDVSPQVWYRIRQHRAAALLLLHRASEALVSAQQALDIDPNGIPALLNASYAAVETGDLETANRFLERAVQIDPNSTDIWAAKVQVETLQGKAVTDPPASIAESDSYRFALAQIAINAGDWRGVVAIVKPLVACGKRDPKILLLLATALAALSDYDPSEANPMEAEEVASQALADIGDDHALTVRFLVLRAELRREIGDVVGSEVDLQHASELNARDPDVLGRLAQAQLHAGHAEYAMLTLSTKETEEQPMLLLIRARARMRLNDKVRASADLHAAISRVADAADADSFHIYASETALLTKDLDLADQQLDTVGEHAIAPDMRATLRGRIAYERRDAAAMELAFRNAAAYAPSLTTKLFVELAQRLLRLDKMSEAVAIFEEIGLESLPRELHGDYAGALVASNELHRAAKVVGDLTKSPDAPEWALRIDAEIAARQGDANRAVDLLSRVAQMHPDDMRVAFELARRLLLMRQADASKPYLDALLAAASALDASQRMLVAHLLKEAGRRDEAIALAFATYRSAPYDAAMHRALGDLLMLDPQPMHHPGYVTADTYVKLTSNDGETREYVIYAEPPIDPRSHEMLLAQAESAGYVGKRVGEVIVRNQGTREEQRWTVAEILPAVVYVFRDIMAEFEKRFEGEPFFIQMFKIPDEPSMKDFAPLVSTLHARREHAESVFKIYRENVLPLGFAASMLGAGLANVMATAMTDEFGPLAVEWFDAEGQEASRAAARAANDVVLTRSALETLADLDLLNVVLGQFTLIAPHTLLNALEGERLEAEEKCASGRRTISSDETGLRADEVPPQHPTLVARMERAGLLLDWVRANVRSEFRPLETIGAPDSQDEEVRTRIGDHSMDAVRLTEHLGITMLSDDLGLRRFMPTVERGQTFSSVSLIPALAERGAISAIDRDRFLLRLVERRYVAIVPTPSLLAASLHPSQPSAALARDTFALLGGPVMDLGSVATVAAEALRDVAVATLQFAGITRVVGLALDGMSRRWPPKLCAYALANAAATHMPLMPTQLKGVRDAIGAFLKRADG